MRLWLQTYECVDGGCVCDPCTDGPGVEDVGDGVERIGRKRTLNLGSRL